MSRLAGALALATALGLAALGGPSAARAHIVVGTKSVRALVAESDLVLRARVVEVRGIAGRSQEEPGVERPDHEVEVLEVLKGALAAPRIRFVQHGHGVATFEPGREHLLFLVDIARSRELGMLAASGADRWVSLQEHDEAYLLDGGQGGASDERSRAALLAATRAYVAAEGAPDAGLRGSALRGATLALLESGDARLAASALSDLAVAPDALLVTPADRPALEKILDDPSTSPGVRVALLVELERRGVLAGGSPSGEARWIALLADDAPSAELVVAIRAAGQDARPALRARLLGLLASERTEVAAAAANAIGRPGDASVVPALTAALASPSSQVRHAAIRGLGRTQTEPALRALEQAGANHPDPATRRLAGAEARKRRSQPVPSSAASK